MEARNEAPQTLLEAVQYFADEDVAVAFVANLRWPAGYQECPRCGSVDEHGYLAKRRVWKCRNCKKQFSVKQGTIFESSPIPLSKWMPAMWMLVNCKNGISSYELGRAIGVTQKSAWFMLHRIRLAMQTNSFEKFDGDVEVDETFIGGAARFMHKDRKDRMIKGRGPVGKVAVMGLLQRHGEDGSSRVRIAKVSNTRKRTLQPHVREHVEPGANVYSDSLPSYEGLKDEYVHGVIDHSEKYVDGKIHTNGLENFWSLLKRAVKGTYVSVEPFHLFRYLDEQAFRFNEREGNDAMRFLRAARNIVGKRLTYESLIGNELSAEQTC